MKISNRSEEHVNLQQTADQIAHLAETLTKSGLSEVSDTLFRASAEIDLLDEDLQLCWGGPFNGQHGRETLFLQVVEAVHPAAIVETGTFRGITTEYMAEHFAGPIVTCELDSRYYFQARERLRSKANITVYRSDSRVFLQSLPPEISRTAPVIFYLDAHWNEDLPLKEEIDLIAAEFDDAVIMIDDFQVPFDDGYEYDNYGPGKALTLDLLKDIRKKAFYFFFPTFPSQEETGAKRGIVILASSEAMNNALSSMRGLTGATRNDWMLVELRRQLDTSVQALESLRGGFDLLIQERAVLRKENECLRRQEGELRRERDILRKNFQSQIRKAEVLRGLLLDERRGKGVLKRFLQRDNRGATTFFSPENSAQNQKSASRSNAIIADKVKLEQRLPFSHLEVEGVWSPDTGESMFGDFGRYLESRRLLLIKEVCRTTTPTSVLQIKPWVGMSFMPTRLPDWILQTFEYQPYSVHHDLRHLGAAAKGNCRALMVFSEDHASQLTASGLPTITCKPPLPPVSRYWSRKEFDENKNKAIVQVGWWLMRPRALHMLPTTRYRRIWVRKASSNLTEVLAAELHDLKTSHFFFAAMLSDVEELDHVSRAELERLLSTNIAFAHYLDTSAPPPLLQECIALHAPILVNRLPAIEEYLGSDYPLYYYSYDDAIRKAADTRLVQAAHDHLQNIAEELSSFPDKFVRSAKRHLEIAS